MFKLTVLTSFIALLCTAIGAVDAKTIAVRVAKTNNGIKRSAIVNRDVVSPPITYPTTGTVWTIGSRHNVTWDTSAIPSDITSNGMIVLGFLDDADPGEHLDLDHPLAKGFPINNGRAEITVPTVTTRNTYILVLFGDSGNASGKFTIKNISIGKAPPSSGTATPHGSPGAPSATGGSSPGSSADGTKPSPVTPAQASAAPADDAAPTSTAPASPVVPPATQGSTVAGSAAAPTSSTPSSSAHRTAVLVKGATWMAVACALGVVVPFA